MLRYLLLNFFYQIWLQRWICAKRALEWKWHFYPSQAFWLSERHVVQFCIHQGDRSLEKLQRKDPHNFMISWMRYLSLYKDTRKFIWLVRRTNNNILFWQTEWFMRNFYQSTLSSNWLCQSAQFYSIYSEKAVRKGHSMYVCSLSIFLKLFFPRHVWNIKMKFSYLLVTYRFERCIKEIAKLFHLNLTTFLLNCKRFSCIKVCRKPPFIFLQH